MPNHITGASISAIVALICVLSIASPLYAVSAEDLLKNPRYAGYIKLLEKYYPEGEKRQSLTKEINAILKEFDRIRQRVKATKPFKYKIATLAPEGTAWISYTRDLQIPFIEEVSKGTTGITLYTGGVMGEDKDVLRKMKMGQLHGCGCGAQGIIAAAPELSVFNLPFLFRNYQEVDYILSKFRKDIEEILFKKGLLLFTLIDSGNLYVFLKNNTPTLDDLKKQKFTTWFGNIDKVFLQNLGITPIPIPITEVFGALTTGMANAGISPAGWMLGMQAYKASNYFLESPVAYSIAGVVLEKRSLEEEAEKSGITKKDAIRMAELSVRLNRILKVDEIWNEMLRDFERRCLDAFMQAGMKPTRFSDDDMHTMELAGRKTWDDLSGKDYSKELLDRVIAALDEYRKNHPM